MLMLKITYEAANAEPEHQDRVVDVFRLSAP
jgi:hypothetical protein